MKLNVYFSNSLQYVTPSMTEEDCMERVQMWHRNGGVNVEFKQGDGRSASTQWPNAKRWEGFIPWHQISEIHYES